MKYKLSTVLLSILSITLIYSCGQSSSGGGEGGDDITRQNQEIIDESESGDKNYRALFETLNPHVNGTLPGSLSIQKKGDRLLFYARLFAGKPKAWHPQGIYLGSRCPNLGDDSNGDGYIDIQEAMNVIGEVIIPLDANLNSQKSGSNFYPLADLSGYYHYERSASLRTMMNDLKSEDKNPDDHITKVNKDANFSFLNKVVLIQGVDEKTELPETVATLGRRKSFQTLPIACGIIREFNEEIGSNQTEDVASWPVADVIDGQDRPALPGENETWEDDEDSSDRESEPNTNESSDGEVRNEDGRREGNRDPRPSRPTTPENETPPEEEPTPVPEEVES